MTDAEYAELHVVTCYDCAFEESWFDDEEAIRQRDLHEEETNHEVYLQRERVRDGQSGGGERE